MMTKLVLFGACLVIAVSATPLAIAEQSAGCTEDFADAEGGAVESFTMTQNPFAFVSDSADAAGAFSDCVG